MIFSMKSALIFSATIGAMTCLVSTSVHASGSESISSGPSNDTRLYNAGKGVYADKFSCNGCPLAGKPLNAELAKEVLAGKPKIELSSDEADALAAYLKRRFRV
jgi:hypothetical protein